MALGFLLRARPLSAWPTADHMFPASCGQARRPSEQRGRGCAPQRGAGSAPPLKPPLLGEEKWRAGERGYEYHLSSPLTCYHQVQDIGLGPHSCQPRVNASLRSSSLPVPLSLALPCPCAVCGLTVATVVLLIRSDPVRALLKNFQRLPSTDAMTPASPRGV